MSKLYTMAVSCFVGGGVHAEEKDTLPIEDATYLLARGMAREATPEEVATWNKANGVKAKKAKPEADKPVEKDEKKAEDKGKEEKPPVVVNVPFSDIKDRAKALGVPIKGSREVIEAAIADAEKATK